MSGARHPSEQELLRGAIRTVEETLLPELEDAWARSSALGLVGQLRYALARSDRDSLADQDAALEACLEKLLGAHADLRRAADAVELRGETSWDLRAKAASLLVLAQEEDSAGTSAVRAHLRPLLVAQVTEDLAESGPMLQAFLVSGSHGSSG